ncbi:hypothetical protein BVTX09c5_111 [Bovine papular stomatitis virus]|uniref:Uncharacterized protein n=1 Tax=Bovine papular stomatitis virus TaxID=129727 RepID=A0A0E3XAD3_9POXV|nr:hypothetical protein BVTX09c15_111 [Bovine papular stomatitis virus]AKC03409.1 hypothetical protein BVTX09c5_111 [Bovine papular stomatitis virus]
MTNGNMSCLQILTPFGLIFAPDDVRLREIALELGITYVSRAFGDMLYGEMSFTSLPMNEVPACVSDCYLAVNGNLIPCTESFRLRIPMDGVKAAYRTGTGKTILCGPEFNVVNPSGFRPALRLRELSHVAAHTEILELHHENGNYEFIMGPSARFMTSLMAKESVCLFGSGWCVVDLRRISFTP